MVGDIQGCAGALDRLLAEIGFSASRDHVYVLGDLVNRGPDSLGALRLLRGLGPSATCLLGNHDWHLLAVAVGVRRTHRGDTVDDVLQAPDRDAWLEWLRQRRMAVQADGWLMVHAGVIPQWDVAQTLALAGALEQHLRTEAPARFLASMFQKDKAEWSDALAGDDLLRFTLNTLTRARFVDASGTLDFAAKEGIDTGPPGFFPWFDAPGRKTAGTPIAFGHWSTLGLLERPDTLCLDTGCVWGGPLTAVRIDGGRREVFQVPCEQSQRPG